jgi:hypothetical protein
MAPYQERLEKQENNVTSSELPKEKSGAAAIKAGDRKGAERRGNQGIYPLDFCSFLSFFSCFFSFALFAGSFLVSFFTSLPFPMTVLAIKIVLKPGRRVRKKEELFLK